MSDNNAGPIVDGLGITTTIGDDDLVAAGALVLKVVEPDGSVNLRIAWSDGMSWLERLGMLRAAERMELPNGWD